MTNAVHTVSEPTVRKRAKINSTTSPYLYLKGNLL